MNSDTNTFYVVLAMASAGFVVIPILMGIIRFRVFSGHHKALFVLLMIALCIDIISYVFWENNMKTALVFRIYTLLEFALLSYYFIKIVRRKAITVSMKIVFCGFVLVTILDATLQGVMSMDNYSIAIESIVFILYSIIAMLLMIKEAVHQNIFDASEFWIIIAVLIYFAGNLFVFVFSNYLLRGSPQGFVQLWGINSVLNIMFYTLIAISFWKIKAQEK